MTKKILLVEHHELTCRVLYQELSQYGYDVVFAADGGDEGILMAVTESPDLIIVATDLPVIDGWQTIKILKASVVTQKIPIIALMELATNAEWSKVSESGCDDYELKPVDLTSILYKIKALLDPAQSFVRLTPLSEPAHSSFQKTSLGSQELKESQTSESLSDLADTTNQAVSARPMVVYVDDSPLDSQVMSEIVKGAGYRYNNIADPLDSVPILLELRPQLIFLDLVMPFTNGYELCAQIRRTSTFRKIPIFIVTNNDGIIDRVRARFVGASGFFGKPVKEQRILKVLNKYLKSAHSYPSQHVPQDGLLPFV